MKNYLDKLTLNANQPNGQMQIYLSPEDEHLGQLLILGDINEAAENNKRILKQIIGETKNYYFNSIAQDTEKALEDALQKINFSLSETIKQTSKKWLNQSKVIIITIKKQEVHFSKIGKIAIFLVSNQEITSIIEGSQNEEVNPVKTFANIYSGALPDNSALLFLTENILDYISQEKLKKISLDTNTIDQLATLLKKTPDNKSLGCILIKREKKEKKIIKNIETENQPSQTAAIPLHPIGKATNLDLTNQETIEEDNPR